MNMEQPKVPAQKILNIDREVFEGLVMKLKELRDTAPEEARLSDEKVMKIASRMVVKAEQDGRGITAEDISGFENSPLFNDAATFVDISEKDPTGPSIAIQDTKTGQILGWTSDSSKVPEMVREYRDS